MSKNSLKKNNIFGNFRKDWIRLKKEAVKTEDYELYVWFLNEVKKEFTKLYARLEKPELVSLVEHILKTASCEIKEIMIKYKKAKIPF